jgi:hypothetical protein
MLQFACDGHLHLVEALAAAISTFKPNMAARGATSLVRPLSTPYARDARLLRFVVFHTGMPRRWNGRVGSPKPNSTSTECGAAADSRLHASWPILAMRAASFEYGSRRSSPRGAYLSRGSQRDRFSPASGRRRKASGRPKGGVSELAALDRYDGALCRDARSQF